MIRAQLIKKGLLSRWALAWISTVPHSHGLIALAIALVSFMIYALTLAPTVYWGDSAELATAADHLGIPHPPGYPLYVLLGKAFVVAVPFGDVAYRVNVMSVFFASLTMGALYLTSWPIVRKAAPALMATLVIAFSRDIWESAVVAEVYSLHVFFMVACILAVVWWKQSGSIRALYVLAALVGLALAHHRMILLVLPALLYGVVALGPWRKIRWPHLAMMATLVATGLLFYLYLPLRYMQEPALDAARLSGADLTTLSGFLEFTTARIYQGRLVLTDIPQVWEQLTSILSTMTSHLLLVGMAIVVAGALRQYLHRRRVFVLISLVFLANLLFISAYRVPDISQFIVVAIVPLGLWLAEGLDLFLETFQRWLDALRPVSLTLPRGAKAGYLHSMVPVAFLSVLPIAMMSLNFTDMDIGGDRMASDYGRQNLEALPQDAVLWMQWPNNVFWYTQMVEGIRPDIEVVDFRYLIHRAVGPEGLKAPVTQDGYTANTRKALDALEGYSGRPLFLTTYLPLLASRWAMEPYGDLYRLTDKGAPSVMQGEPTEGETALPIFGGTLRLVEVTLEPRDVFTGQFVRADITWRALDTPQYDNDILFMLQDSTGQAIEYYTVKQGHGVLMTRQWPVGTSVSEYYDLLIPYSTRPGRYFLLLALGNGATLTTATAGTLGQTFDWIRLGEVQVAGGASDER
ncbi:MAG: DUF2723 domain-containing protein [Chloroflexi bacterium]|nr:DUF2723 domain-containing protein [Chloroflexota bacterium]